jgi:hypothetical protein
MVFFPPPPHPHNARLRITHLTYQSLFWAGSWKGEEFPQRSPSLHMPSLESVK